MNVADFDFDLPEHLIAQEPPPVRGASRLLVVDRGSGRTTHTQFSQIGDFLREGDLLVLNNTRVFPARLLGQRDPSGGNVECLLLRQLAADRWEALVHPGQKLKPGARMIFRDEGTVLHGEILEQHFYGRRTVRLSTGDGSPVDAAVDAIGHIPLPPYIKREDRASDRERYQTVYARSRGSIAAPTAGLHFTERILDDLERRGVERTEITLHVGYGTFKPVRTEIVEEHAVDPEPFEVSDEAAKRISSALRDRRRVIAVGTTTVRALESLELRDGNVLPGTAMTDLFIYPGHRFRVVAGMVTNFHLPRSSLLMLVAALGGQRPILAAYREAVREGYRFYSYGDAMLVV
jgi:S-adenosylmethionine:tRNA ribosyltransferase-isomerase